MRVLGVAVTVLLVVAVGLVSVVQAAPLDLKQVAADAKWVASVDVDAMRASTVVQNAWKKAMEMHKGAGGHLGMVKNFIGMDPRTDLHGITAYGKQVGKPEGVLIINAKIDPKPLSAMANKAPGHQVVKYGDYEIHTWTVKARGHERPGAGAFFKGGLVFAGSADDVKAALNVIDGKAPSAGPDSPVAGPVPPGTTALMRVSGIAAANLPCKSPVAKQMEAARFVMGENNGQSFFRGKAVMTNPEIVGQVKTILDGGRAMALLHVGNDAQLKKMVDALKVTAEGKTLLVSWNAPASEVWDVMQKVAKKMAEKHAKMKGRMGPWQHKGAKKGPAADKKACACGKCPACQKAASEKKAHPGHKAPASREEF